MSREAALPIALALALAVAGLATASVSPVEARGTRPFAPAFAAGIDSTAAPVPGDSLLEDYVHSMSDSTDVYFGASAARPDTAGLDSALAKGLAILRARRAKGDSTSAISVISSRHHRLGFDWGPAVGFNRADGAQLGLCAGVGSSARTVRLAGELQYTTGQKDWLGHGGVRRWWGRRETRPQLGLTVDVGRWTRPFDREPHDEWMTTLQAVIAGEDRNQYLRRDGLDSRLELVSPTGWLTAGFRDQLESSLDATTSWTLTGADPVYVVNLHAAPGRAAELRFGGGARVPHTPLRLEAWHWTGDPRLGGDFRYRRTRLAAASDLSLTRHVALALESSYGRLRGDALPQEAFYLGGASTVRSLDAFARQGTGRAVVRADLLWVDDVLAVMHVLHPAMFPLQLAGFAGSGAVWGRDPVTGRAIETSRDGPERSDWASEAGVGLLWRPGLPAPDSFLRIDYVIPIGPDDRSPGVRVTFQRVLGLVHGR